MPQRMKRVFRPSHKEAFRIAHDSNGNPADLVGIHQGREEVRFFLLGAQENITTGKKTSGGWRYYPVPETAEFVSFGVSYDQHPKVNQKIITIAGFLDQSGQEIPISRE